MANDLIFVQFMNKEVAFLWSKALDSGLSASPAGLASSQEPAPLPEALAPGS